HIGECSARHHQIVAPPAAVTIEISRFNPARLQIFSSWRSVFDRSCRRNVIGRYRVAENAKCASASNLLNVPRLHREILKERRLVNIIALLVPLVDVATARWNVVPLRILIGKIAVEFPERTEAATRSYLLIVFSMFGWSGPELPMQVVQP